MRLIWKGVEGSSIRLEGYMPESVEAFNAAMDFERCGRSAREVEDPFELPKRAGVDGDEGESVSVASSKGLRGFGRIISGEDILLRFVRCSCDEGST